MKKSAWIITDRKIKIAVLGCGRISKNHFDAIKSHSTNLELVAVCDNNLANVQQAMTDYAVKGYSTLEDMLVDSGADVIVVCTPSGTHALHTISIATAGYHVITEKPMATRWRDGLHMVKACSAAQVRLFVVKQNRRNATLQLLKKAITAHRFGRIYLATVNVFWTRPQEYYDQAAWRGTWEQDGGAFMNQASHYIDLLHWLIGPVQSVQAMMATLARNIEAEDTGVLNLRWRNGALGSVSVTMLTYPHNLEGSITILGEKGSVKIGGVALNEIQLWNFDNLLPEDAHISDANYTPTSVYGFGHTLYYDNVVQTLRGTATAETDGRDGLASLELLIAAYRAARDNVTVALPLEL